MTKFNFQTVIEAFEAITKIRFDGLDPEADVYYRTFDAPISQKETFLDRWDQIQHQGLKDLVKRIDWYLDKFRYGTCSLADWERRMVSPDKTTIRAFARSPEHARGTDPDELWKQIANLNVKQSHFWLESEIITPLQETDVRRREKLTFLLGVTCP